MKKIKKLLVLLFLAALLGCTANSLTENGDYQGPAELANEPGVHTRAFEMNTYTLQWLNYNVVNNGNINDTGVASLSNDVASFYLEDFEFQRLVCSTDDLIFWEKYDTFEFKIRKTQGPNSAPNPNLEKSPIRLRMCDNGFIEGSDTGYVIRDNYIPKESWETISYDLRGKFPWNGRWFHRTLLSVCNYSTATYNIEVKDVCFKKEPITFVSFHGNETRHPIGARSFTNSFSSEANYTEYWLNHHDYDNGCNPLELNPFKYPDNAAIGGINNIDFIFFFGHGGIRHSQGEDSDGESFSVAYRSPSRYDNDSYNLGGNKLKWMSFLSCKTVHIKDPDDPTLSWLEGDGVEFDDDGDDGEGWKSTAADPNGVFDGLHMVVGYTTNLTTWFGSSTHSSSVHAKHYAINLKAGKRIWNAWCNGHFAGVRWAADLFGNSYKWVSIGTASCIYIVDNYDDTIYEWGPDRRFGDPGYRFGWYTLEYKYYRKIGTDKSSTIWGNKSESRAVNVLENLDEDGLKMSGAAARELDLLIEKKAKINNKWKNKIKVKYDLKDKLKKRDKKQFFNNNNGIMSFDKKKMKRVKKIEKIDVFEEKVYTYLKKQYDLDESDVEITSSGQSWGREETLDGSPAEAMTECVKVNVVQKIEDMPVYNSSISLTLEGENKEVVSETINNWKKPQAINKQALEKFSKEKILASLKKAKKELDESTETRYDCIRVLKQGWIMDENDCLNPVFLASFASENSEVEEVVCYLSCNEEN